MTRPLQAWCLGTVLLALGACQTPNVQPFADATADLHVAVSVGGRIVQSELQEAKADGQATEFALQWEAREAAFSGMVDYATALVGIAGAAQDSAASIDELKGAVEGLAGAVGVALPGTPAALATATDLAKFVYTQIANLRANRALDAALTQVQPAVDRLAEKLTDDLRDMDVILQAANTMVETRLSQENSALFAYHTELATAIRASGVASADAGALERRTKLSGLLAECEPEFNAARAGLAENAERLTRSRELLAAAATACTVWAGAHRQLATAVRDNQTVSVQSLVSASQELRRLVERIRDL